MNAIAVLLIFFGGGLGSVARFAVTRITSFFYTEKFPLATLISNSLACLLVGIILLVFKDKINESDNLRNLWIIGFCGGFSTFSAFSHQTVKLLQDGFLFLGILNVVLSIGIGFGIIFFFVKS